MPMAEQIRLPHKLTLEERSRLTLAGAVEILRFDEQTAVIALQEENLVVQGRELKLKTLSLEGGTVSVTGRIDSLYYEQPGLGNAFSRWLGR